MTAVDPLTRLADLLGSASPAGAAVAAQAQLAMGEARRLQLHVRGLRRTWWMLPPDVQARVNPGRWRTEQLWRACPPEGYLCMRDAA